MKNNRDEKTNHEKGFHKEPRRIVLSPFLPPLSLSSLLSPPLSRTSLLRSVSVRTLLILRAAALPPELVETISRFFQHFTRRGTLRRARNDRRCFQHVITTPAAACHAAHAAATTARATLGRFSFKDTVTLLRGRRRRRCRHGRRRCRLTTLFLPIVFESRILQASQVRSCYRFCRWIRFRLLLRLFLDAAWFLVTGTEVVNFYSRIIIIAIINFIQFYLLLRRGGDGSVNVRGQRAVPLGVHVLVPVYAAVDTD